MPTVRKYSSRSQQTTLTSAVTSTATTINVGSGAGLLGGATVTSPEIFTVVIDPDTALEEIVDVTAVSTNSLTIVRGRDGSSGQAHSAGAVVRHMAIGRDYREANDHINDSTSPHGLTIANVLETTDTNMITTAMLQSNSVTTAKITDLNVTTGKIADSAITSAKIADLGVATGDIADLAITTGKIAAEAVTTAKIPESAITNSRIAADAVTSDKIAADAVGTSEIADGAVTSAKIANGTIVDADVNASAAIAKTKLNLGGTITSADLVDGTIVATDIADGTITAAKMVSDPYARANHTGTQTASTISNFDTQVRTSRLDQMAAPTASVALNAQKITGVADPTLAQDASTKAYVDAQVNALVDGAPGTLNTLNEIATAISSGGSFESTVVLKSGSTMTGALTLSGAPSSNLHAATKAYVDTVAGSATAAAASAAAAATTYDNFDDRYLGAKSTAPSVDNDGNALLTGALYWNSVSNTMFAWSGSAWGSISSTAEIYRYRYTAAGGETTESGLDDNGLTLSYIPGKEQVYLNGVLLVRTTDYTASNGTSITSLAALTAGDILEIITFTAFDLATAISNALFDAKGDILVATAADTPGKLTVGSNNQALVADSSTATGLKWATPTDTTKVPLSTVTAKGDLIAASGSGAVTRLAVGNNGETIVADSSTSTGLRYQGNFAAGKNAIINGAFDIWQRGTSFTTPASGSYTSDRWVVNYNGSGSTIIISRQAFTAGAAPVSGYESSFFFRYNQSVAGTGGTFSNFATRLEDVRLLAGQTATLSYWAKADATRAVTANIEQNFGSGGSSPVYTTGTSVNLTTSWVRYTQTFTVPSISGKTIGTSSFLSPYFDLPLNSTFTIDVWGVQLEASPTASAFQTATGTIQGELAACQRYYFRKSASNAASLMYFGTGYAYATNAGDIQITLPVQMRVTPTAIDFSALGDFKWEGTTSANTPSAIGFDGNQNNPYAVSVNVTKTAGFTTWQAINFMANGTTNAYLGFSAEL